MSGERAALLQQIKIIEDETGYIQPVVTQPTIEEIVQALHSITKALRRQMEYSDACALET